MGSIKGVRMLSIGRNLIISLVDPNLFFLIAKILQINKKVSLYFYFVTSM